jgi:hypothetical protein
MLFLTSGCILGAVMQASSISMSEDSFLEGIGRLAFAMIGNRRLGDVKIDRPSAQLVRLIWSGKCIGTAAHQSRLAHFDPPIAYAGADAPEHTFVEWAEAALNRATGRR